MHRRAAVLVLIVGLLGSTAGAAIATPVAGAAAGDGTDGTLRYASVGPQATVGAAATADGGGIAAQTDEIRYLRATTTMALTPAEPGTVAATIRFAVPDNVEDLEIAPGALGTVADTDGFERSDRTLVWDGETATPSVELSVRANRSSSLSGEVVGEGYTYVDTGSWAIVPVPSFGANWSYRGSTVRLSRTAAVDGAGATGGGLAYLGPHETVTRSAHGQQLRLVVPTAAEMTESRTAVLDALANASGDLEVGERDATVLVVAAPTTVDWGVGGLQIGAADAWVRADAALDSPDNVWLHEYVHTRQDLRPAGESRWLIEATASYYAALLTYQADGIAYETFRRFLDRGTRAEVADAVLDAPSTWETGLVPYRKGALVAGAIDRRLRLATEGGATFESVLRRLNGAADPETALLVNALDDLGGSDVAAFGETHVSTSAVPQPWSRSDHLRAYEQTVAFDYRVGEGDVTIHGPYRAAVFDEPGPLVDNETLAVRVRVTNDGIVDGPYNATLSVNGSVVAGTGGELNPGRTEAVIVEWKPDAVGHYAVRVADRQLHVTVLPPAELTVTDRSAPATVAPGEPVELSATVANDADRPAVGTVDFVADGKPIDGESLVLEAGESRTVTATTVFDGLGEHTVTIAGEAFAVAVREPTSTTASATATAPAAGPDGSATTDAPGGRLPGFGPVAALAGLLLAAALLGRRPE